MKELFNYTKNKELKKTPTIQDPEPELKPELKPKDSNLTAVLLILLAAVVAFFMFYKSKQKENE